MHDKNKHPLQVGDTITTWIYVGYSRKYVEGTINSIVKSEFFYPGDSFQITIGEFSGYIRSSNELEYKHGTI